MPSPSAPDTRLRQCAACRQLLPRDQLLRLSRLADGSVAVGMPAAAPGRGAYVCRSAACYTQARKYRRLEKALRAAITPHVWAEVEAILGHNGGAEAAE